MCMHSAKLYDTIWFLISRIREQSRYPTVMSTASSITVYLCEHDLDSKMPSHERPEASSLLNVIKIGKQQGGGALAAQKASRPTLGYRWSSVVWWLFSARCAVNSPILVYYMWACTSVTYSTLHYLIDAILANLSMSFRLLHDASRHKHDMWSGSPDVASKMLWVYCHIKR